VSFAIVKLSENQSVQLCLYSGVGVIAVLYCVLLVTVKYLLHVEDANRGSIRYK